MYSSACNRNRLYVQRRAASRNTWRAAGGRCALRGAANERAPQGRVRGTPPDERGEAGQDIVAHIALKPTSSMRIPGKSIDRFGNPIEVVTHGRELFLARLNRS